MKKVDKKEIKVLHINVNFTNNAVHKNMLNSLDKLSIVNKVYVPTCRNESCENSNVTCSKCFNKIDRVCFQYKQSKIFKDIQSVFDIKNFDCLHAYTLFTDGNVANKLKHKYNIPYVVAIRSTDVNYFFKYRPYLRKKGINIMCEADAIFFLSQPYKTVVFNKYIPKSLRKIIEKKTYIIPNGLDNFWIENVNINKKIIDKNNINVIYAGKINKNKNVSTTQKALDYLRNKGMHISFNIVGEIQNKKIYNNLLRSLDTKYYGIMTKQDLLKI